MEEYLRSEKIDLIPKVTPTVRVEKARRYKNNQNNNKGKSNNSDQSQNFERLLADEMKKEDSKVLRRI